ncbi:hypothetical protein F4X73_06220 [Candidatus Poribacteria bacterium]|nr:hypothetical protein [Candidatus Poribacteria bacterium]
MKRYKFTNQRSDKLIKERLLKDIHIENTQIRDRQLIQVVKENSLFTDNDKLMLIMYIHELS